MMNEFSYSEDEARNVLGRFLFQGDDVFKTVSNLSGGEQARLALLKLFLQGPNFLILDEPTNHLDIPTREITGNRRSSILAAPISSYPMTAISSIR